MFKVFVQLYLWFLIWGPNWNLPHCFCLVRGEWPRLDDAVYARRVDTVTSLPEVLTGAIKVLSNSLVSVCLKCFWTPLTGR